MDNMEELRKQMAELVRNANGISEKMKANVASCLHSQEIPALEEEKKDVFNNNSQENLDLTMKSFLENIELEDIELQATFPIKDSGMLPLTNEAKQFTISEENSKENSAETLLDSDTKEYLDRIDWDALHQERISELKQDVNNFVQQVKNAETGTIIILDKRFLEKSERQSIKEANEKQELEEKNQAVKNKRRKNKIKNAVFLAGGIALGALLYKGANAIVEGIQAESIVREDRNEFFYGSYKENLQILGIGYDEEGMPYPQHDHAWENMIQDLHAMYEDPLTAFYMLYSNLDKDCRENKIYLVLSIFNNYYHTDYKSVEDILEKNNLKSLNDLRKYVSYDLQSMNQGGKGR